MKKILTISTVICVTIMFIVCFPLNGNAEVIHGCYSKLTGALRILSEQDRLLPHCTSAEIAISWNSVSGIDRVIRGTIESDGSIVVGTGFTVSTTTITGEGKSATTTHVKFNTPFAARPTCVLTPLYTTWTSGVALSYVDSIFFCDWSSTTAELDYECFVYQPTNGTYCCDGATPPVNFICTE